MSAVAAPAGAAGGARSSALARVRDGLARGRQHGRARSVAAKNGGVVKVEAESDCVQPSFDEVARAAELVLDGHEHDGCAWRQVVPHAAQVHHRAVQPRDARAAGVRAGTAARGTARRTTRCVACRAGVGGLREEADDIGLTWHPLADARARHVGARAAAGLERLGSRGRHNERRRDEGDPELRVWMQATPGLIIGREAKWTGEVQVHGRRGRGARALGHALEQRAADERAACRVVVAPVARCACERAGATARK